MLFNISISELGLLAVLCECGSSRNGKELISVFEKYLAQHRLHEQWSKEEGERSDEDTESSPFPPRQLRWEKLETLLLKEAIIIRGCESHDAN